MVPLETEQVKPMPGRVIACLPYLLCAFLLLVLPFFMNTYYLSMLTKVLVFCIFAMSLNIVLGYTGLLSLGHAVYLGIGGYTAGILMVRYGIYSFWLLTPAAILLAGFTACILGFLALRISGVYFLLITLAFGELFKIIAVKWGTMTGGTNGLIGIGYPSVGIPGFAWPEPSFYFLVVFCFLISFFLLVRITASSFGRALVGIRENEPRMQSLGFNTWAHKYLAFIIAGLFGGLSGVLFALFYGIMVPDNLGLSTSASVMLMVVIGSPGTLAGPIIGSILIVLLEHFTSIYAPERWPLILGAVFVLSVAFLRGGVGIYLGALWKKAVEHCGNPEG
ncbi:MAG: branched-chain amino acid ABC transporter permease [Thermodesulfobacteriota bacterium]